jgi:hypothetical protein
VPSVRRLQPPTVSASYHPAPGAAARFG